MPKNQKRVTEQEPPTTAGTVGPTTEDPVTKGDEEERVSVIDEMPELRAHDFVMAISHIHRHLDNEAVNAAISALVKEEKVPANVAMRVREALTFGHELENGAYVFDLMMALKAHVHQRYAAGKTIDPPVVDLVKHLHEWYGLMQPYLQRYAEEQFEALVGARVQQINECVGKMLDGLREEAQLLCDNTLGKAGTLFFI